MKKSVCTIGTILCFGIVSLFSNQATAQSRGLDGDGNDDRVAVPHSTSLNVENAFTLECWFYDRGSNDETNLMEKGRWEGSWLFFIKPYSGQGTKICLASTSWSPTEIWGTTDIQLNTWYHYAATWDGTTRKVYLNGVLESSDTPSGTPYPNTDELGIGAASGGTYNFNGTVDDARIYNIVKTDSEIAADYSSELTGTEPGLVLYYKFDEAPSFGNNTLMTPTVHDYSGNGNDGTLTNYALMGCTSNYICGAPALGGVCVTPPIVAPGLQPIVSSCAVTVDTAQASDACATVFYNGTTNEPYSYSIPGTYTVNWMFEDGAGDTVYASQAISIIPPAVPTNVTYSGNICTTGTGSVTFDITGGYSPYSYSFGSFASGSTATDTVWADSVIAFSTQYSDPNWAASQVLGAPDTYPNYGDIPTAWTSSSPNGGREFLVYHYPVTNATEVLAYITLAPGFIDTVYVHQVSSGNWITIYSGTAGATGNAAVIEHYPIPALTGAIDGVRLAMDCAAVSNYNEIDALGLVPVPQVGSISINDFPAGVYTLSITDSVGCVSSVTSMIGAPDNSVVNSGATLMANQTDVTYQWIDCNNGGAPMIGENGQSFTAVMNGSYAVVLTSATCTDTSACELVSSVGIATNTAAKGILVYPNPSTGMFTIETAAHSQIIITNILGEEIVNKTMEAGKQILDLQNQSNGVYFIKVIGNNKQEIIKLIKD